MENFRGLVEMEKHLPANTLKDHEGSVPSNGDTVPGKTGKTRRIFKMQFFSVLSSTNLKLPT